MSSRTDKRDGARRAIKGWVLGCALAAALMLGAPAQQAWAAVFTGAYLTDMAGNPINANNPIDINMLSEGVLMHFGPDADSPEIYRDYEQDGMYAGRGFRVGVRDLQTGIWLRPDDLRETGDFEFSSHHEELSNDKITGYSLFRIRHPQPGKQYQLFYGILKSPDKNETKFEYGVIEAFAPILLTKAGEDGTGDGGDASDGGSEAGTGAQGGSGSDTGAPGGDTPATNEPTNNPASRDDAPLPPTHDTSPEAGELGGQQNASPTTDTNAPVAETGTANDVRVSASEDELNALGESAAQGARPSSATGAPTSAFSPSGLEAAAAAFRNAARGARGLVPDLSQGESGQPNTSRQVTGAQMASIGTVRTLSGTPDATDQLQELELQIQQMQEVLSVTGYPWLWIALMAVLALALPLGVLARSGAGRISRHLPTRLRR